MIASSFYDRLNEVCAQVIESLDEKEKGAVNYRFDFFYQELVKTESQEFMYECAKILDNAERLMILKSALAFFLSEAKCAIFSAKVKTLILSAILENQSTSAYIDSYNNLIKELRIEFKQVPALYKFDFVDSHCLVIQTVKLINKLLANRNSLAESYFYWFFIAFLLGDKNAERLFEDFQLEQEKA